MPVHSRRGRPCRPSAPATSGAQCPPPQRRSTVRASSARQDRDYDIPSHRVLYHIPSATPARLSAWAARSSLRRTAAHPSLMEPLQGSAFGVDSFPSRSHRAEADGNNQDPCRKQRLCPPRRPLPFAEDHSENRREEDRARHQDGKGNIPEIPHERFACLLQHKLHHSNDADESGQEEV